MGNCIDFYILTDESLVAADDVVVPLLIILHKTHISIIILHCVPNIYIKYANAKLSKTPVHTFVEYTNIIPLYQRASKL